MEEFKGLAKRNREIVGAAIFAFVVVCILADSVKPTFDRVSFDVNEESLHEIYKVVVVNHFESATFVTGVLVVHQTLVEEQHGVGVTGCSD